MMYMNTVQYFLQKGEWKKMFLCFLKSQVKFDFFKNHNTFCIPSDVFLRKGKCETTMSNLK